jgi:hypothetical protein
MTDLSSRTTAFFPTALQPLPLGAIKPSGWLRRQLAIQAAGLTGHLDEFWPSIANSGWIGGNDEGWERAPYWLDGLVPLAILLDDERLKQKSRRWIDYILEHQHEDGWLGPVRAPQPGGRESVLDPWPQFVLFKALIQWYDATRDPRVIPAMLKAVRRMDALLADHPLESWAKMRWMDLAYCAQWLFDQTGESIAADLAQKAGEQGYNWHAHFADFKYTGKQLEWLLENHVVNHAMALKEPAVRYRRTGNPDERGIAHGQIAILDRYHGQATGIFTGDESLAGLHPSQGTELCAVVEYMFSLELLMAAFDDTIFADRWERIAYNALPATFTPDMWAHQYVQQANQVVCKLSEDRIYTNNGPDSNLYGLEPNFGCCTANMHQGWPKFVSHLWLRGPESALTAMGYAPCQVDAELNGAHVHITVETDYPFEDEVRIRVHSDRPGTEFPLRFRVPGWATDALISVDGATAFSLEPGTFHVEDRAWSADSTVTLALAAPIRIQSRPNLAVTVERGPLVFALKIGEEIRPLGSELYANREVHPTTRWAYALVMDLADPAGGMSIETTPVGEVPFLPATAPVRIRTQGVPIGWELEHNAAAIPPAPPFTPKAVASVTLVPYGCTNIRLTEIPVYSP